MMQKSDYHVPLSLTIISGIFLALGAISAVGIAIDIILRRGWRSMMGIMIPVYIINATYLGPFAIYFYSRFGRPAKPKPSHSTSTKKSIPVEDDQSIKSESATGDAEKSHDCHGQSTTKETTDVEKACHKAPEPTSCHKSSEPTAHDQISNSDPPTHACHSHGAASKRPYWATVLAGVFHCGAGCVLGDVVGEWLVYGANPMINGHSIWPELLIDYAFALVFGIVFQYFSIAPMSGQWGPMTIVRAAKADILSLTSFEVGAFAWMIIFQVGIWNYRLDMDTWVYWWMMQFGMCLGVSTAFPMNWWLIKKGIKEPCC